MYRFTTLGDPTDLPGNCDHLWSTVSCGAFSQLGLRWTPLGIMTGQTSMSDSRGTQGYRAPHLRLTGHGRRRLTLACLAQLPQL